MSKKKIHIGTSGWQFDSWHGPFYPESLNAQDLLPTYAKHFDSVELNNSFYHLPGKDSIRHWKKQTPRDFIFSCKASRFITHMKKLKDPEEHIDKLLTALKPFGRKLGPILFQLPPSWRVNKQRLETFLKALPGKYRYTFEFRDRSWLCEEIYTLLADHDAALCLYDLEGFRSPEVVTTDFVYVRLHGPQETAYQGSYDGRRLAGHARKFLRWAEEGCQVYCYFDNDQKACAPRDAEKLQASLERQQ